MADRRYLLDVSVNPDLLTNGGQEEIKHSVSIDKTHNVGKSKVTGQAVFTSYIEKYNEIKIHSIPIISPCEYKVKATKPFCISQITLNKITLTNIQ